MRKGFWKVRLAKEFKRGQASVKVRMEGPGVGDPYPVYFIGLGATGEILFEDRKQLLAYARRADKAGAWPIRWVMTIEPADWT